ncbi:MAG: hypothetical protein ACKVOJ_12885 [Sphingomonadaceae bacterium]
MNIEPIAISVNSAAQTLGIGRTSIYALLIDWRRPERTWTPSLAG